MIGIRRGRASDAPFIRALSVAAFSEFSGRAGQRAASLTRGQGVATIVAEWRQRPAGFAVMRLDTRGEAHLDAIAVIEEVRGLGIGRALLGEIELMACERGARSLDLITADSNLAALALFLRAGFAIVGRLPRHYPRRQDAVILRKALVGG